MKISWKPAVFVLLNLIFVAIAVVLVNTYLAVYNGEDPLALLGVFVMDVAFAVIGIGLLLLNRAYPVPLLNRLLPWLAVIGFTATAATNVSPTSLIVGIAVGAALALAAVATTVLTLLRRGR